MTCLRHICMPFDKTIKKYFHSRNNLFNATFQSHPIKMVCRNTNKKSLIVPTINPMRPSSPVYSGINPFTNCSLNSKENIIFAHNFILKQNKNQASHCFDFHLFIFFFVKGLDISNQLQSILTFIVYTIVSAMYGNYSKQPSKGP